MPALLPILSAISSVATTAWDTYSKIKQARQSATTKKGDRQVHQALVARVEELESACLDQAQVLSELSKELDQFAQALNAQNKRFKWALSVFGIMALSSLSLAIYLFLR